MQVQGATSIRELHDVCKEVEAARPSANTNAQANLNVARQQFAFHRQANEVTSYQEEEEVGHNPFDIEAEDDPMVEAKMGRRPDNNRRPPPRAISTQTDTKPRTKCKTTQPT